MALKAYGGGSGLNTVVIANRDSSNSCELANDYCQRRQVPPQNVLYIDWSGNNTLWTSNDLQTNLVTPLLTMLQSRGLTHQIFFVVLSMDIPFETSDGSTINGTTSALFYGLRLGDGTDPFGTTNSYAASEGAFSLDSPVAGAPGYSFLTTMITGDSLAQAEQMVDQGVASDGTFPQQPVILAKSSDPARNIRYAYFDNAIFDVNVLGISSILRTNTDSVSWPGGCLGYETGLADFEVPAGTFVPGAIADSLTSFGGDIFGNNAQTNELAFIDGGAAGSYGTVSEPDDDTQKFPNPEVYFYQARGFNLAESYYQSINEPYLGLIVGEPLAAPFAQPGHGQWGTNVLNAVLTGVTNLSVSFNDLGRPLQQVDLFVDGLFYATLTNILPAAGNTLTASLNGYPVTYTVPTDATLGTVANGLAASINAVTNATQVTATAYGDRIQLESDATNPSATPFYVPISASEDASNATYRVGYLPETFAPLITPGSPGRRGAFNMQVGIPSALPYVILASTNLWDWQPIFTNVAPGLLNFTDPDSTNYPARFYRMSWPAPSVPRVTAPRIFADGFQMRVQALEGDAWAIQTSTDLIQWISIFTNEAGGSMAFLDTNAAQSWHQFYRASLVTPPAPVFSTLSPATNLSLLRVTDASLPYSVEVSTNSAQWTPLTTNFDIGQIQTAATSAMGSGRAGSTFLTAAQPQFLASQARGQRGYMVISNAPPTNAWMQFVFTKTNGQAITITITNQSGTNSLALARQMFNAINANAELQGGDGAQAEDFVAMPGLALFNIYARSPGLAAAQLQVQVQSWMLDMSNSRGPLTQNLSDLEPRNHLYVTAGQPRIALTFPLATTNLADGYHEVTAVAYEGSDVRTETQASVPVQIRNSGLSATLTVLEVTNAVPAEDSFQIQATANTNNVSLITLFSIGGAFAAVTNESAATFQVAGTNFWAGQVPFYAVVQTRNGLQYRTQTLWVTITP
ncbi:MAG: TIGR03790 family protein [Limisphaerales bacterium]